MAGEVGHGLAAVQANLSDVFPNRSSDSNSNSGSIVVEDDSDVMQEATAVPPYTTAASSAGSEAVQSTQQQIEDALCDIGRALCHLRLPLDRRLRISLLAHVADVGCIPPSSLCHKEPPQQKQQQQNSSDDPRAVQSIKRLEGLLFPRLMSAVKPAELCYTDLFVHMVQEAFR